MLLNPVRFGAIKLVPKNPKAWYLQSQEELRITGKDAKKYAILMPNAPGNTRGDVVELSIHTPNDPSDWDSQIDGHIQVANYNEKTRWVPHPKADTDWRYEHTRVATDKPVLNPNMVRNYAVNVAELAEKILAVNELVQEAPLSEESKDEMKAAVKKTASALADRRNLPMDTLRKLLALVHGPELFQS